MIGMSESNGIGTEDRVGKVNAVPVVPKRDWYIAPVNPRPPRVIAVPVMI